MILTHIVTIIIAFLSVIIIFQIALNVIPLTVQNAQTILFYLLIRKLVFQIIHIVI